MPPTRRSSADDLHGNAPDDCSVALLLIDVITDFRFEDGERLLAHALSAAARTASLKQKAAAARIPIVYLNDNFGRWRSDFKAQLRHCLAEDSPGRAVVELLVPEARDYFVLKPKHSGFFATSLEILLEHLGSRTLILTGFATDRCVLFTAVEAYLRGYGLVVPKDCVAAEANASSMQALELMTRVVAADTRGSTELDFAQLLTQEGAKPKR